LTQKTPPLRLDAPCPAAWKRCGAAIPDCAARRDPANGRELNAMLGVIRSACCRSIERLTSKVGNVRAFRRGWAAPKRRENDGDMTVAHPAAGLYRLPLN